MFCNGFCCLAARPRIHTSPAITYAGHELFTSPDTFNHQELSQSLSLKARVVLQCMQRPGYETRSPTIGSWVLALHAAEEAACVAAVHAAKRDCDANTNDVQTISPKIAQIAAHIPNHEMERITHSRGSIIPFRLLVKVEETELLGCTVQ